MIIYVITASYQGTFDGIEIATFDRGKANDKYRQLVRDVMGFHGRDNPWEDVEAAYKERLEDYRYASSAHAVEEYHIDAVEIS